jgi:hypothetical protein
MEFTIQLDKDDWKKYQTYLQKEFQKGASVLSGSFWLNALLIGAMVVVIMFLLPQGEAFHWHTAGVVAIFFILTFILFLLNLMKMNKAFEPSDKGIFIGEHHFKFDEDGIHSRGKAYEGRHAWSSVMKVERSDGMILIFMDSAYAFLFPEHKLENPEAVYQAIGEYFRRSKKLA